MQKTHQTLSVRLPRSIYIEVANLAAEQNLPLTVMINQLLETALCNNITLTRAVALIIKKLHEEESTLGPA